MLLSNPLIFLAILFALLGLIFLIVAVVMIVKKRSFAMSMCFITSLLMIFLSALFGTISIASQGYHTLTSEELAATIRVEPTGEQNFNARVLMPNGSEHVFALAGDQLYVDAHILKWKPPATLFGLRTSYELANVAGRYTIPVDGRIKDPAAYSLSYEKPLNMFDLRQKYVLFDLLLDVEHASAAVINTNRSEEFSVMVSLKGLLLRKIDKEPGQ
jgi:hypothetical protein